VDNIFAVDFKNDVIITGGQDRRVGIYNIKNKTHYHKLSQFFVYGVGLSPSGEIAAYSSDMDNNIELFSVNTRESLGKYKTNKMIVNGIYFINEKEFFVNSSSNKIGFYKTK
jgi:WD40 repeat protein